MRRVLFGTAATLTALSAVWWGVRMNVLPPDPSVAWSGWASGLFFGAVTGLVLFYLTSTRPRLAEERRIMTVLYREIMANLRLATQGRVDYLLFVDTQFFVSLGPKAVVFLDERASDGLRTVYRVFELMRQAATDGLTFPEVTEMVTSNSVVQTRVSDFAARSNQLTEQQRSDFKELWTSVFSGSKTEGGALD